MIIKTTDELLALRNEKGIIRVEEDLRIECDIPWCGVGELVDGLYVRGNLDVRGYLDVRGNLDVGGYLDVGGNLDGVVVGYASHEEY